MFWVLVTTSCRCWVLVQGKGFGGGVGVGGDSHTKERECPTALLLLLFFDTYIYTFFRLQYNFFLISPQPFFSSDFVFNAKFYFQ